MRNINWRIIGIGFFIVLSTSLQAQNISSKSIKWTPDGNFFLFNSEEGNRILKKDILKDTETELISEKQLTPTGATKSLAIKGFSFTADLSKFLIYTNTQKVWRYETKGDYWIYDAVKKSLSPLGKGLPSGSLMFAKFSPDLKWVGYVSGNNIYAEELATGKIKKLTTDGNRKLINGTFDWAYEEEFGCRDGFRWSPDGKSIAYWQIDARKIRDYYMLNTIDSVYSNVIPVEYPKVGENPSSARIGIVPLSTGVTKWMKIEGDPAQHYLTRMEWSDQNELIVQQLDRKQQESKLIYCSGVDGNCRTFWAERDEAWVDLNASDPSGWTWINKKQEFLWVSEKDGWRHIYKISKDGKTTTLLTKGNFDVDHIDAVDEVNNYLYFTASPQNPNQRYLYRVRITPPALNIKIFKEEEVELVSPSTLKGTHSYEISPNGKLAMHKFENANTPSVSEWVTLPEHAALAQPTYLPISKKIKTDPSIKVEYFKIKTIDDVELDAWMVKPTNFNPNKKYPMVVYVYGEPGARTTDDTYGNHNHFLYDRDMAEDGYIQLALDNRGTPSLKGSAWRKSIYRRNGQINIRDMAMGVRKVLEQNFVDKNRVAVWGWSGGGSSTLHLLFQFPDMFQTGISIAPITNLLFYDNIYTERYMGLPSENMDDFIKGSPITHAKGLKGNLLLIHGTGDDNVHYSNSEALVSELVKEGKQFQFMPYPNKTHSLEGTYSHLSKLYSDFLRKHCPPGAK
jgi:dipeptidyl-peptidase-4